MSPKIGLSTGDVVIFRTKGFLLAATPVPISRPDDSIIHILAPSDITDLNDRATHLEIIRQGQWVGFRSAISNDKLLQARSRGSHRLVFFSSNLGTWEQWEIVESSSLESMPWSSISVTLKNRRLPTCILDVDVVRVGTCIMMPHASITPRSLTTTTTAGDASVEDQNIRKMSGLLVNVCSLLCIFTA